MPKREPVKISFQPARTTPSKRVKTSALEITPKPRKKRHDLYAYVKEHEGTGVSISELISQYQEYDCEHRESEQIESSSTELKFQCKDCGRITRRRRAGVKKDDT